MRKKLVPTPALFVLLSLTSGNGKMNDEAMAMEAKLSEIESGTMAKDLTHCFPHLDHPRLLFSLKQNFENSEAAQAHTSYHDLQRIMDPNNKDERFAKGVKVMTLYIAKGQRSYPFSNLVIGSLAELFYTPRCEPKEQRRFADWLINIHTSLNLPAKA